MEELPQFNTNIIMNCCLLNSCNSFYFCFFKPAAWLEVMATRLTMSLTEQPRERSLMGAAIPCKYRSDGFSFSQSLHQFIGRIAHIQIGKDQYISIALDGTVRGFAGWQWLQ